MTQPVSKLRSVVVGVGSYLPERRVSNADLEKFVDTTDEWIVQRTGIRARYIAAEGETTSMLATKAAQRALDAAGLGPNDIDLIVLGTSTPDFTFPSSATQVQAALGMTLPDWQDDVATTLRAALTGLGFGELTS